MKGKSTRENSNSIKAVHVGISGFPFGSAAINKCLAVYQSLNQQGVDFLIINNKAVHKKSVPVPIDKSGAIEDIDYVYTTYSPYKSDSFWVRRVSDISGRLNELRLLVSLAWKNEIDVMFFYPNNGTFIELIYYRILSKLFRFPLISHYVEYRSSFKATKLHQRISDRLFDNYFMYFVDAVLPISEYLIDHLKKSGFEKPYLKIPPLADFSKFRKQDIPAKDKYFLYVGTAAYMEAIEFITQAFDRMEEPGLELYLVVNGSEAQRSEVEQLVQSMKRATSVKCFSSLTYEDLIQKYMHASALLIPLTDSVQDKARFPQKISEYLASGNPIITTNYGEVPFYFKNEVNALVASSYDTTEFARKMDFVAKEPDRAVQIGREGLSTGLQFFDYNSYAGETRKLIVSLL
jgi:glycosyltransferase involved in cell wall biosynthesis